MQVVTDRDEGLFPAPRDIDIAVLNVRKPYCLSGKDVVDFAETVEPSVIIPIHWMPEDDTYSDGEEIEHIRQNIPGATRLVVLEPEPST